MLRAALLSVAVLAFAACGGDEADAPSGPFSVAAALAAGSGDPIDVHGFLFLDRDETLRLCSALAESYPPQCGRPALDVEGLPPHELPALERAAGVAWSWESVTLRGTVDDGVLRVVESR